MTLREIVDRAYQDAFDATGSITGTAAVLAVSIETSRNHLNRLGLRVPGDRPHALREWVRARLRRRLQSGPVLFFRSDAQLDLVNAGEAVVVERRGCQYLEGAYRGSI